MQAMLQDYSPHAKALGNYGIGAVSSAAMMDAKMKFSVVLLVLWAVSVESQCKSL